ncbi:uncharacterized protein LOC110686496 [Chenopodium quinoa]|uniref:uncharacterized protein LOC110686496 n=1 Tax=Chenopodium quinoa TaxID=63459 RepID=UPI000B796217|nr:uncharacterized protein LOC110686496 [Chenopodium quinoa]XP_021718808.1 uncharacterized protein LOC110686496 [Chenopodium quinoa]
MEKLANDLLAKVKSLQQKDKKKHKIIELKDQDYVHDEDQFDYNDDSEQEFFEVSSNEIEETNELVETLTNLYLRRNLHLLKKKIKKKPLCPSMAMDDFIKLQQQKDPSETQQVDVKIQNLETHLRSKRKQTAIIPFENQTDVSVIDNPVVVPPEKQGPIKKTRGPTNMFEVHARKWEDRVAIYCNDKGQPIGPSKAKDELSLFLGTIVRDQNWAPLIYTDWHKVPNKDKIWEYVQVNSICINFTC